MTGAEKRFSEDEVRLVLRRAAELQEATDSDSMGMTDLLDVASQVGIGKDLVLRAASEMRRQPVQELVANPWLGASGRIVLECTIDGEVPVEAFDNMVVEIQRGLGEMGKSSTGWSLAWSAAPGGSMRQIQIGVVPLHGTTSIRIEERLTNLIGGLFGGLLGGLGGGGTGLVLAPLFMLNVPLLIPVGLATWFGGVYCLTRKIYRARVRVRERELRYLLSALVEAGESSVTRKIACAAAPGLDALPEATSRRRRRKMIQEAREAERLTEAPDA